MGTPRDGVSAIECLKLASQKYFGVLSIENWQRTSEGSFP